MNLNLVFILYTEAVDAHTLSVRFTQLLFTRSHATHPISHAFIFKAGVSEILYSSRFLMCQL